MPRSSTAPNWRALHAGTNAVAELAKRLRPKLKVDPQLAAKAAALLVVQQKRSWGVKEIHPFAGCILCDSCPCPADGVCFACGMHFCQMCVRKVVPCVPCIT